MSDSATAPDSLRLNVFTPDDLATDFRVVVRQGTRRGIRLERLFWTTLKQLAEHNHLTIGEMVEEIAQANGDTSNLASAIRVACLRWMADQSSALAKLASLRTINAILGACPAPAFALSSGKKILTFNPAFQHLVRRQLPVGFGEDTHRDLRLSLDLNVTDIFARLDANDGVPIASGFVIGAAERRYRGQLNIVRAPIKVPELLLSFVVNA
ncbi:MULTISPECIES: ribbon-helix-helix domain-containing protein [Hyphomicrobiales]|uniref:ribbon-helix-helix domain-containing protein n=1 Tax=Hyphomicrobiales TaxID=356 RepID=UPI0003AA9995|nr:MULTISPECIES: ribbon-helix-helix domain-containing protein [Phyllobacteriaceae]MCX8572324.1 ribbon-helix-helix domain-containing protein [Aminobacter sp. MET-1]